MCCVLCVFFPLLLFFFARSSTSWCCEEEKKKKGKSMLYAIGGYMYGCALVRTHAQSITNCVQEESKQIIIIITWFSSSFSDT